MDTDGSPFRRDGERPRWQRTAAVAIAGVALALSACGPDKTGALPSDTNPQPVATSESPSPDASHEQEPTPGSWSIDFGTITEKELVEKYINVETFGQVPEWNDEDGAYVEGNVRLEGGKLVVAAKKEPVAVEGSEGKKTYEYSAGRFDTKDKLLMGLGTLTMEVEFNEPVPLGGWAAPLWILHNDPEQNDSTKKMKAIGWDKYYADYAQGGEADAVEVYGYAPYTVDTTVHTEETMMRGWREEDTTSTEMPDLYEGTHTFSIVRTEEKMEFLIDGNVVRTFKTKSKDPDKNPFIEGPYYVVSDYAVRESEDWMTGDNADLAGIDEKALSKPKGVSYSISQLSFELAA